MSLGTKKKFFHKTTSDYIQRVSTNICAELLHYRHYIRNTEALRYKSEDRGFDSHRVSMEFFIDIILPAALWPWR